jgi:general secretion pathway protein H
VWISPSGYGFEERRADGWQPLTDDRFAAHDWPEGTQAVVDDRTIPVRIVFDPMGTTVSPVEISLRAAEAASIVHLAASGELKIDE